MDQTILLALLGGAWTTAWISALAIAGGVPLGLLLALLREAQFPVFTQLVILYVSLGRATPLVTLVLFTFFGAPTFGIELGPYATAIVALTMNTAAFNAEV